MADTQASSSIWRQVSDRRGACPNIYVCGQDSFSSQVPKISRDKGLKLLRLLHGNLSACQMVRDSHHV